MQALYRKYRPKTFSELVGQEHVKSLFINSLKNNEISHSYIFAGPRGTGKTTVARILAKSLNCENKSDGVEPCNKCKACVSIDNGNFMDVLEIDAASNRGIDEIRRIRETVGYHTAQGKYKVYIIDEVHMLTKEAFNALLKTLEEPPENVVFILATTNPEKIPQTIISRCQVIDFKNITLDDIAKRIKFVAENENISISDDSIYEIAKRANGGLRDALTILEQVSKSTKNISLDDVREVLGLVSSDKIEEIISNIENKNIKETLKKIEEIYFSGKDLEIFLSQMIEELIRKIENGNFNYIKFLNPISDILKSIKYSEEKLILTKLGFIKLISTNDEGSKGLIVEHEPKKNNINTITTTKGIKKPNNLIEEIKAEKEKEKVLKENEQVLNKVEKTKSDEKSDYIKEILEYLKIFGDLSLYVGLSLAKIEDLPDKVLIKFSPDKKVHYELVKSKKEELEKLYASKSGLIKKFEIVITNPTDDNEILNKLTTLLGKKFEIEGE